MSLEHSSFEGRTLARINDLSNDEKRFLFKKAKELKIAILKDDKETINTFRINDPHFGICLVFLEDSTRTRESFTHAARFHNIKYTALDVHHSSFNKSESFADTFNNLTGYDNTIFVVRSKHEGLCTWLSENGKKYAERHNRRVPSFINAGDGRHEHPTQELLDQFTFLEDNNEDTSSIHVALVGDLLHGRTVHSKVDGLTLYDHVIVDCIAPQELAMPKHYIDKMKKSGFHVRTFASIEEYMNQKIVATKWYFTRPQLERMGEDVLTMQARLRSAITFQEKFLPLLPKNTYFYHPLPRHKVHPTIPHFLDATSLNHWEKQSANGRYIRIILLGMLAGHIEFPPSVQKEETAEKFVEKIEAAKSVVKEHSEGIRPLQTGLVIDHIGKGSDSSEIWGHIGRVMEIMNFKGKAYTAVDTSVSEPNRFKGIIALPQVTQISNKAIRRLAAVTGGCTINMIENHTIQEKYRLTTPPKLYGLPGLCCKNCSCISHPSHSEQVPASFIVEDNILHCKYCSTPHSVKEVWKY